MQYVEFDTPEHRKVLFGAESGIPEINQFGRHCTRIPYRPLKEHMHEGMLEISYLGQGKQTFAIGKRHYHLKGGDVFFTLPHEKHGTSGKPVERNMLYWLLFPRHSFADLLNVEEAEASEIWNRFAHAKERLAHMGSQVRGRLDSLFLDMEESRNVLESRIRAKAQLVLFVFDVLRAFEGTPRSVVSFEIRELTNWIDAHLAENLNISALASHIGLSESRFKVRFHQETGMTPADYVMRQRVARAKEYLSQSGKTVTEIAFELGFSSSQYFATTFRRYEGVTPSDFRSGLDLHN